MSGPDTRLLTRGLLEAARRDGPGNAGKARIWEAVSVAPHLALVTTSTQAARDSLRPPVVPPVAPPAAAGGGAVVAGGAIGKILLAGVLAGSVLTAGVGAVLWRTSHHTPSAPTIPATTLDEAKQKAPSMAPPREEAPSLAKTSPKAEPSVTTTGSSDEVPEGSATHPSAHTAPQMAVSAGSTSRAHSGSADPLMREAALVSAARTALMQGSATSALALLDTANASGGHSLEPEELSLRVRALRMLGRDVEAHRVEQDLKTRYPDNFLAQ